MAFLKILPGILSVCLLSTLLCSCASSNRMMRVSPFTEESSDKITNSSGPQYQIDRDGSRINTWPMLYKINDKTSILWPMIDSDKKGFAVRPFYNQEGKEYSIMFPLSAWNPENGDGWVFSGYWNKDVYGIFPFVHHKGTYHYIFPVFWNKDYLCSPATLTYISDDFNMAGPVWWYAKSKNLNCGFFPIVFLTNGLYSFGPFWVDTGTTPEAKTSFGFFPFAKCAEKENYTFPLYYYESDGDSKNFNVLLHLLASIRTEGIGNGHLYIFPYYSYRKSDSVISSSAKKWQKTDWLLLWYSSANQDKKYNTIMPFYYYEDDSKEKYIISPLGGVSIRKDNNDLSMINIMGFLYHYDNSDTSEILSILFPLSYHKYNKKDKTETTFIFPYYHRSAGDKIISTILPMYYYSSEKTISKLLLPALLSNYKSTLSTQEYDILFPFIHAKTDKNQSGYSFWPLFSYQDRPRGIFCFEYNKNPGYSTPSHIAYKAMALYGNEPYDMSYRILLNSCKNNTYTGVLLPARKSLYYSRDFNIIPVMTSYKCYRKLNSAGQVNVSELSSLRNYLDTYEKLSGRDKKTEEDDKTIASLSENIIAILKKYDYYKGDSIDEVAEGLYLLDKKFTTEETSRKFDLLKLFSYEYSNDKETDKSSMTGANLFLLWLYYDHNPFNMKNSGYYDPSRVDSDIMDKSIEICQKKLSKPIYTDYNLFCIFNGYSEYSRETRVLPVREYCTYENNFNLLFLYIRNNSIFKTLSTENATQKSDIETLNKKLQKIDDIKHERIFEDKKTKKKPEKSKDEKILDEKIEIAKILKKYDFHKGDSNDDLAEAIADMDAKFTKEIESSYTIIPGLFYNKKTEGKGYGNIMLFFSRWNSDDSKKQSMINVLEYLFRYQHENGNSYRDMFPFMSLDNGPEMFRASFLWRLIGCKREKEERTWYVFFMSF